MDLLSTVAEMFGTNQRIAGAQGVPTDEVRGAAGLRRLMAPEALGGLADALFGGPMAQAPDGGATLWAHYQKRVREDNLDDPQYEGGAFSPPAERAERLIRTLIFAARAAGHLDGDCQEMIHDRIRALRLGEQADRIVSAAMNEPADAGLVAKGVMDEEEALQLFVLSCTALSDGTQRKREYLAKLASALSLPDDVRDDIMVKTGVNAP